MHTTHGKQVYFNLKHDAIVRRWGNMLVYGAIFILRDFDFHIRTLDSYHICSMSTLMRNHKKDLHHRYKVLTTPITFDNLDDFSRLKYDEKKEIEAYAYFGNPNHHRIKPRVKSKIHRIISGIDAKNFKKLWGEINEKERNE